MNVKSTQSTELKKDIVHKQLRIPRSFRKKGEQYLVKKWIQIFQQSFAFFLQRKNMLPDLQNSIVGNLPDKL